VQVSHVPRHRFWLERDRAGLKNKKPRNNWPKRVYGKKWRRKAERLQERLEDEQT
jgi:hypothetical protein